MSPALEQVTHDVVLGLIVAGLGSYIMWPFRKFKGEWDDAMKKLDKVQDELELQRTNHLSHIEKNGDEQLKTLDKAVNVLEKIHDTQTEMNGFLKGRSQ